MFGGTLRKFGEVIFYGIYSFIVHPNFSYNTKKFSIVCRRTYILTYFKSLYPLSSKTIEWMKYIGPQYHSYF